MIINEVLKFKAGYLRCIDIHDISLAYIDGLNNPSINRFLEVRKSFQDRSTLEQFVSNNRQSEACLLLGIWSSETDTLLGTIRVHDINPSADHCFLGICIFDPSFLGCGFGSQSIKATLCYLANSYPNLSVEAHVHKDNLASSALFRSCGFNQLDDKEKIFPGDILPSTYEVYHSVLTPFQS